MSGRDIGASVRQRLLNRARAEGRPFQEVLQYFAMERFLYRLAKSAFADRFVLKGALLLKAWKAPVTRPTMDIDLARAAQWRAFVRRSRLDAGWRLERIVEQVHRFAAEPLAAVAGNRALLRQWGPGGPWE